MPKNRHISRLLKKVAREELHSAVETEPVEFVEQLIRSGAEINSLDKDGRTPLHIAAIGGNWDMIVMLLQNGANPLIENKVLAKPSHVASLTDQYNRNPFDILPPNARKNFIWKACAEDFPDILLNLISPDTINMRNEYGNTPLAIAAANGHLQCVRMLLNSGADVLTTDVNGNTPILYACKEMKPFAPDVFLELIGAGSPLKEKDLARSATPLSFALAQESIDVLRRCIEMSTVAGTKVMTVDLSNACLHSINPNVCTCLGATRVLDVRCNYLKTLPPVMGSLPLDRVHLEDNPMDMVPPPFRTSWNKLRSYLQSIRNRATRWTCRKLLLVGEEAAGKTTLVQCLKSRKGKVSCKKNISTNGVEIHANVVLNSGSALSVSSSGTGTGQTASPNRETSPVTFNIWDLGGQECESLYLIVFDVAALIAEIKAEGTSKKHLMRIDYWLRQVRAMSSNSSKVGTHADDPAIESEYLERAHLMLKKKFPTYCFNGLREIIFVSCRAGTCISQLKEALVRSVHDKGDGMVVVPSSWVHLHEYIQTQQQSMPQEYVPWDQYEEWAVAAGVLMDEVPMATEFLRNVGSVIHFNDTCPLFQEKTATLRDIVILSPQWLADIMACVVTFRHKWIKNGILKYSDVKRVFEGYPESLHPKLLALLQSFSIIFLLPKKEEDQEDLILVPSVLPENFDIEATAKLWDGDKQRDQSLVREFGRVFSYPYIPSGLISRMLVRMLHLSDVKGESFWRKGLFLRYDSPNTENHQLALIWLDEKSEKVNVRVKVFGPPNVREEGILLRCITNCIETMNDCYYNLGDRVEQTLPCTHCLSSMHCSLLSSEMREPFYFTYAECVKAITEGKALLYCNHIRSASRSVSIRFLAPDVTLSDLPTIQTKDLMIEEQLGKGGFGIVYRGILSHRSGRREYKTEVAIKELKPPAPDGSDEPSNVPSISLFAEFQQEAYIMSRISHRNLVRLYGVTPSPLRMVLEYIPCGDLFHFIHPKSDDGSEVNISASDFNWRLRLLMALDIALGMRHLSSLSPPIIHRDLRSPNIFLASFSTNVHKVRAKVGDFGLSRMGAPDLSGALGTWQWLAPEVILGAKYGCSADVYSFAVCCYEIATRRYPFDELYEDPMYSSPPTQEGSSRRLNVMAIKEAIVEFDLRPCMDSAMLDREGCPDEFAELIKKCWDGNPDNRPSFNTAVRTICKLLNIDPLTVEGELDEMGCPAHEIQFPTPKVNPMLKSSSADWSQDILAEAMVYDVHTQVTALLLTSLSFTTTSPSSSPVLNSRAEDPAYCLWAGTNDGMIHVYDTVSIDEIVSWSAHDSSAITSLVYANCKIHIKKKKKSEGKEWHSTVWSSGADGSICVWDSNSYKLLEQWHPFSKKHEGGLFSPLSSIANQLKSRSSLVRSVDHHESSKPALPLILESVPTHNYVLCASTESEAIQVWSTETMRLISLISLPDGLFGVSSMATITQDQETIVWVASGGFIVLFDVDKLTLICAFSGHTMPISTLHVSKKQFNGQALVISGTADGELRGWSYEPLSGELEQRMHSNAHSDKVTGLCDFGDYFLSASLDGALLVWADGSALKELLSSSKSTDHQFDVVSNTAVYLVSGQKVFTCNGSHISLWCSMGDIQVSSNQEGRRLSDIRVKRRPKEREAASQRFFSELFQSPTKDTE